MKRCPFDLVRMVNGFPLSYKYSKKEEYKVVRGGSGTDFVDKIIVRPVRRIRVDNHSPDDRIGFNYKGYEFFVVFLNHLPVINSDILCREVGDCYNISLYGEVNIVEVRRLIRNAVLDVLS